MRSSPVINFKVNEVARGFLKLSDGSTIIHRVAIVDVRTTEVGGPFNVNFEINIISGISVYPSSEVLEKIKNNPIITPGKKPPDDGWVPLDIVNKKNSIEEIIYTDKEIGSYKIKVEIEPTMVAINQKVKTASNEPFYVVRWFPKFSWKKIKE